jgi:tRNA-splicing endonuclease subunit Sen2
MADVEGKKPKKPGNGVVKTPPRGPSKSQQMSKIYSLPVPLRTYPLPSFIPNNPISLFHILYTWVSQTVYPPSSHPDTPYEGWFSSETRSVHVTDQRTIRALWEQGFYGKGNLSRSEPSWLDREKARHGAAASQTAEESTRQRRLERQQAKWERARKEREAIDRKLLEERGVTLAQDLSIVDSHAHNDRDTWKAPVRPHEIVSLPNSTVDLQPVDPGPANSRFDANFATNGINGHEHTPIKYDRKIDISYTDDGSKLLQGISESNEPKPLEPVTGNGNTNDAAHSDGSVNSTSHTNESIDSPKRQKSVRFSPNVEQTTFLQSEPPSPELAATTLSKGDEPPLVIQNLEHLQLTLEEAFFLCYGLGVLKILDPKKKEAIPTKDLFFTFRHSSYFPPPETPLLSPDDPFLISYVVYHHFRSLGWIVRGGTKFAVDYLLYNRGPVFSHAEFAVLIIPSYNDPAWSKDESMRNHVAKKERRRWSWLHCVNRVNSQVKKTLVLVYVDIPPPSLDKDDGEDRMSIDGALERYKIREFVVKRWLSNRSRD